MSLRLSWKPLVQLWSYSKPSGWRLVIGLDNVVQESRFGESLYGIFVVYSYLTLEIYTC